MTKYLSALLLGSAIAAGCLGRLPVARASAELDHKYALETVGFLKSSDNVDGLFIDYVATAYKEYFAGQSRFVLQDLAKADTVLSQSRIPYATLIDDPEILAQVSRATRSQTIIRTKIRKEGSQYRFKIDWLHEPDASLIASEGFELTEPRDGKGLGESELKARLKQTLDKLINHIPWVGSITGRDNNSVTLNIGSDAGLSVGDSVIAGTLEEVKVHPLLKEVVEWKLVPTGRIKVDQVDSKIAFGHQETEEPDHTIARQQKILQVYRDKAAIPAATETHEKGASAPPEEPVRIGWVSGGLGLGALSRNYGSLTAAADQNGSGLTYGIKADSQVWLTQEWLGELGLGYNGYNYSQTGSSGGLTHFKIAGGYSYLIDGDIMGPKGWLKVGYRSTSYQLPTSSAAFVAPIAFHTLFLGIGTDLPIRDGYGALLGFDYGLFNGASESTNLSGDSQGVTDIFFTLGGYYRYTPRITFKVTVDFQYDSADFQSKAGGAAYNPNVSMKTVEVVPAIVYFF